MNSLSRIKMIKTINQNFKIAAILIFVSAAIGVVKMLFFSPLTSKYEIIVGIVAIGFVIVIGFLVLKAYKLIKWVLLIITVLGVLGTILVLPALLQQDLINTIFSLLQTSLQVAALVLMFLPNRSLDNNTTPLPENN